MLVIPRGYQKQEIHWDCGEPPLHAYLRAFMFHDNLFFFKRNWRYSQAIAGSLTFVTRYPLVNIQKAMENHHV